LTEYALSYRVAAMTARLACALVNEQLLTEVARFAVGTDVVA
jgi:hypothetical protein